MHDPQRERRRWLAAASEDLAFARHAVDGGFYAPACFHAQQAAEKAVKAVHYGRGSRAVIGHNVRALISTLDPPAEALHRQLDAARELDLFYVPTRYPNGLDEGTPGDAFSADQAERAVKLAGGIIEAAESAISGASSAS